MVKVGIIGCGKIAQVRHIPEYLDNPNAKLTGLYDLNLQRAKELAEKYPQLWKRFQARREYIINDLNHTVTIVNAKGGYSDKGKKMLLCVVSTTEYIKMRDVIREIDKDAFFLITDSYSVANKI